MATSSSSSTITTLATSTKTSRPSLHNDGHCSFPRRTNFQRFAAPAPNMDLMVRRATPETAAAADLLSSFSFSGLPLSADTPWFAAAAGLFVAVPLIVQRLLALTKEVDMAAQTVEKIADAVEKVAEEVDKAAEDMAAALPEGGFKNVVKSVEHLAEETAKDAQKVEDLMDKVEELDDKLEDFLDKRFKGTGN